MITKLKLDKDRKALLDRKSGATKKGKYTEKDSVEENESDGTQMPDKSRKNTENAERTQMGQGGWIGVDCKDYIESEQWWGYGIYCKGRNVAKDVQPQIY
jgi:hypothetical protein